MDTVIQDVSAIGVEAPLEEPFGYSQEWVETRTATLVRIEAADGTVGWGEAWGPIPGTRELIEEVLAPHVIGEPPEPERLYDQLYDVGRRTYQTIVPLPAISGLEIAIWDLAGRLLDQPITTLIGGRRRDSVRPYATGHYFRPIEDLDQQFDAICQEAIANADAVGAVKLKTGLQLLGYGYQEDIELVQHVHDMVPTGTTIMVDANYAYDRRTAKKVGQALTDLDVEWFEEPIPPEDIDGYAALSRELQVDIAGGECHPPAAFDRLLRANGVAVAQPDVCIVGGITPAKRIANQAATKNIQPVPHVWGTPIALAASLQLIGTLPGDPWLEYDRSPNTLRENLAPSAIGLDDDGRIPIPDGPGIGITLDRAAVETHQVD